MSEPTSQELILDAARRLFAERGFSAVTIRQIAREAGLSPAMVIKVGISKEKLYESATPHKSDPLDREIPANQVGRALVKRIVERRHTDGVEPWVQAIFLAATSPNPTAARTETKDKYLNFLRPFLSQHPDTDERAQLIASALIGLAAGVRTLRFLPDVQHDEWIIETYGELVQRLFDGH